MTASRRQLNLIKWLALAAPIAMLLFLVMPNLTQAYPFAAKVDYATGSLPRQITTADFDGDTDLDLAVANQNANTVSVLLGNGDGTFQAKVDYATGASSCAITTADLDDNTTPDVAVTRFTASKVSIFLNPLPPVEPPVITESSGTTDVVEGGATDSYTLVLSTQPTDDVIITVTPDSEVTVDQPTLTFTNGDWDTPQTVTITAVDDGVFEGPHTGTIAHTAISNDARYDGISIDDMVANITDNDPGVIITESSGSTNVTEGGATDSYIVVLNTQPTDDVTITINPDAQVTVDQPTLTFTNGDWDTPQTVTVIAVDDATIEGDHTSTITHIATSSDPDYDGISISDVTADITDNDVEVILSPTIVSATEGGATDSYTLVLAGTQPSDDVTIILTPDSQVTVDQPTLTFTNGDWDTPQIVTVSAVDDALVEGSHTGTITHTATSNDGNYDGITIADVVANITDNDSAPSSGRSSSSSPPTPPAPSTPGGSPSSPESFGPSWPPGTLVLDHGTIYLIVSPYVALGFTSQQAFLGLGYQFKYVIQDNLPGYRIPQDYFLSSPSQSHPWSSWVKSGSTVYYVSSQGLIPVPSWDTFLSNGALPHYIVPANNNDLLVLRAHPNLPLLEPNDPRVVR